MAPPLKAAAGLGISFRPMNEADLPFLSALYASTRAEEVAMTGWPAEMQRQFLEQQFDAQHRHYMRHYPDAEWLVVERAGRPIGRLYIEEWPSQIRIIDISLMGDSRGLGLGRAILEDIIELGRSLSKPISIHVEKNNPARRLYQRLGFVEIEDKGVYDLLEWRPDAGEDQ
jgi:GNAT superfamily N-acetyltransferase